MNIINVALIGYGKAGRVFHEPLIGAVDGLNLKTIIRGRTGDVESAFGDGAIDLVVIATPNASHFDLARRALLAGKHVVVDKPFTITSREAEELIVIAGERDRILTVFQNRRWEGDFLTIRQLIDSNTFGRVVLYEARFDRYRNEPRPNAWRERSDPGSGILYDLGSHLIDQALLLFGIPRSITADVRRERDFGGADDSFDIWMHYAGFPGRASGLNRDPAPGTRHSAPLKVTLTAGMLVRERTPRYTIRGTAASFIKFGLDPQEADLAAGKSPRDQDWGRGPREQWGELITDRGTQRIETLPGDYAAFYQNVRNAIRGEESPAVPASQGFTNMKVLEAAIESSRKRAAVELPLS